MGKISHCSRTRCRLSKHPSNPTTTCLDVATSPVPQMPQQGTLADAPQVSVLSPRPELKDSEADGITKEEDRIMLLALLDYEERVAKEANSASSEGSVNSGI